MEKQINEYLLERLFTLQDLKYRDFAAKLTPTVPKELFIGVRTPDLRKLAAELMKNNSEDCSVFMSMLPHKYYEENNIHGFMLERIRDYDEVIKQLDIFLPYVDNWATCDLMSPKIFKKHIPKMVIKCDEWLASGEVYTIRFAIEMLMSFCLDENFSKDHLKKIATVKHDDYYVKMMVAWYFATALAKQWDTTIPYIEKQELEPWTHNKTIQKAVESYRITDEQKSYLKSLKIKIK